METGANVLPAPPVIKTPAFSQAEETVFFHWFKMCFHERKGKQTMIPYALFYDFMQIYGISGTPCLNFACLSWLRDLIIIVIFFHEN